MKRFHRLCGWIGRRMGLIIVAPNPSSIGNSAEEMYFALLKARREGKRALILFPRSIPWRLGFKLANKALFSLESPYRVPPGGKLAGLCELALTALFVPLQLLSRCLHKMIGRPLPPLYILPSLGFDSLWKPDDQPPQFSWDAVDKYRWMAQFETPLPVSLPPTRRAEAERLARRMGIPDGAWFVCVHVREGGYHGDDISARNATVANYIPAIREITARGGWVIRMGDATMTPLPPLERVIDYPHSRFKSELLDIHLIRECRFYIGMASGILDAALLFQKAHILTNLPTWTQAFPLRAGDIGIVKHVFSQSRGRYLSVSELLETGIEGQYIFGLGSDFIMEENTPEEIRDVVVEYLDRPADWRPAPLQLEFNRRRIAQARDILSRPLHPDTAFDVLSRYRFASRIESVQGVLGLKFLERNWTTSSLPLAETVVP